MAIENFLGTAGDVAGGLAGEGRGKLALGSDERCELAGLVCRDAYASAPDEHELLAAIGDTVAAAGYSFSRALVIGYYVSLKTNPFVILTGVEGHGKLELVQCFAEALVGARSSQYALIPGGSAWTSGTGEGSYYRSLHERFSSWRFLDLLQEAAEPGNASKVYLVCFGALHPSELEYYFGSVLRVLPAGEKRLNLPGFPTDRQPIVPPNVFITATVNIAEHASTFSRAILRHASVIDFRAPPRSRPAHAGRRIERIPPVGYQRLWLRASLRDLATARERLSAVLGLDAFSRLRCSPDLARLLWRGGVVLSSQILRDLTAYVANSFDEHGHGLFDPHDPIRNASIAFDTQVAQRVLWRLRESGDSELRRDLADYLDRIAAEPRQAVA